MPETVKVDVKKKSEKEKVDEIRKRQGYLETDREPWENDWKEVSKLVNPRREFMDWNAQVAGTRIGKDIYDGTPLSALQVFSSGLQGKTASPSLNWFQYHMQDRKFERLIGVKEYLDQAAEEVYYQLQISNFYNSLAQYIQDIGSIGTSGMWIEEVISEDKLNFLSMHPKELYIQENRFGMVDTLHRRFKLTNRNAYEEYGEDLSKEIRDAAEDQPYAEREYLMAVYPNTDRDMGKSDSKNMKYISYHIEYKGGDNILRTGGFRTFPAPIWRWFKNENETYGRSPGHYALVDIKKLNKEAKDMIHAKHLAVDPALMVPHGQKATFKKTPGAINFYNKNEGPEFVGPVHTGADLSAGYEEVQDTRTIIERHFFVDFFLMLSRRDVEMTATEVLGREAEQATLLGPFLSIMNREAYNAIHDRVFDLLSEAGKLPPVPDVLREFEKEKITVEYTGPLAQAQKALFLSPRRGMDAIVPYMQIFPDMADKVNGDKFFDRMANAHGLPADIVRTEQEVAAIRQQRAQELKRQREMEEAQALAKAGKDASQAETSDGDSLLDKTLEGAG